MEEFKKMIEEMAAASLRCVAFAYRPFEIEKVPKEDERSDWTIPENELALLGIIGIKVIITNF
jgi:P-type Ca2+ transporter type 2C